MRKAVKILVLCVIPVLFLSTVLSLTSNAITGSSNSGSDRIAWIVDENIACLNSSFCPSRLGLVAYQVSATAFSDHNAFVLVLSTHFGKNGDVVYREIERLHALWTTRDGGLAGSGTQFVLTSGENRTTIFFGTHQSTTITQIHNYVTGVPATSGTFGCQTLIGRSCPEDVSASLSVTPVSAAGPSISQLPAFQASMMATDSRSGRISWMVSANLGCFSSSFCASSGLRSEDATWTLFSNHEAFGVIIGTQFSSSGAVVSRYEEHVTATLWKIAPSSSGVNDFWIVKGLESTTTFKAGSSLSTVVSDLSNVDTGTPAAMMVYGCSQILGSTCPSDVSAFETVTSLS